MPSKREIETLHRYFLWALRCRTLFERAACRARLDARTWFTADTGLFLTRWYSALFVVMRAWKRLKCEDAAVDPLMRSKNAIRLRRLRNSVCHFGDGFVEEEFLRFASAVDTVIWINQLTDAFDAYFRAASKKDEARTDSARASV